MKKTALTVGIGLGLLLAGCSAKQQTSLQTQPEIQVDETQSEDIMADTQAEADTTLRAPALQQSDDIKTIEADLNSTVVSEESFQ